MEYTGQVNSPVVCGEVKLCVGEDALTLLTPLEVFSIPYVDIAAFGMEEYALRIRTYAEAFTITKLGYDCEPFFGELYAAYNNQVRKALFVQGTPLVTAEGVYSYSESSKTANGTSRIELYGDCVLLLPPDDGGRRIPLCFIAAVEQGDFSLTLRLLSGESYTFMRLGYETEPFTDGLTKQLRTLLENAMKTARELDGSLSSVQAAAIAKLMPEGVAVPIGALLSIAPSFVKALEAKIMESRSAESYQSLKAICDPKLICVGIKKDFAASEAEDAETPESDEQDETDAIASEGEEDIAPDEYMVWMIAPGSKVNTAAVEFAVSPKESAATFVYRFNGGFEAFARDINRAVEAISFKREVIRLTDDELKKPEYAHYAMAIRRNDSLRLIRQSFAGRVIHSSPENWKRRLLGYMM